MRAPLIALSLVLAASCATAAPAPAPAADTAGFTAGANAFGVDFYRTLAKDEGNLFVSPTSISTAFAMTYAGAGGETAKEMARVLHYGPATDEFHREAGAALKALRIKGEGRVLTVANALWVESKLPLNPAFEKVTAVEYGAAVKRLDYEKSPSAAADKINKWVFDQTEQKIPELFGRDAFSRDTKLVLTNTVYMKADWTTPFRLTATQDAPFKVSGAKSQTVPMMRRTGHYTYAKGDGFQMVSLPFKGDELAFVIALPDKADGLAALEKKFTPESLAAWRAALKQSSRVDLQMPRMTLKKKYDLNAPLSAMGMTQAFSDAADFSAISPATSMKISKAIHQTYLMVDETGAEAAAATGIEIVATAAPIMDEPIAFHADHPFLFWIEDKRSGAIVFIGRMIDPTAQ